MTEVQSKGFEKEVCNLILEVHYLLKKASTFEEQEKRKTQLHKLMLAAEQRCGVK